MWKRNITRLSTFRTHGIPPCTRCLRLLPFPSSPSLLPSPISSLRYVSTNPREPDRPTTSTSNNSPPTPSSQPKPQSKPPSHKPPKRRLEAASQPLRNAPSHTRGPVLQCIAHTTAERYDLISLGLTLRSLGVRWDEVPEGDRERAIVIGPWKGRGGAERLISGKDVRGSKNTSTFLKEKVGGILSVSERDKARTGGVSERMELEEEQEEERDFGFEYGERGEIWVFGSGSFVTWGLTEEEGRAFLREVIRRKGSGVEVDRLEAKEYEVEEVDFVVDPTATTHIMGNLILLGRPPVLSTFPPSPSLSSLLARYTLSLSLSRSSSLSVLEDRLDTHIASVSTLPRALSVSGAQPLRRREVIRKLGELMTLRMAVNTRGGGLEETPEFYWSEPELEAYFDSIASEFEIKERIDAINKKIDYAQEVQSTLRALLTEASAHRMEVIIILLIAVEVVIVLIREGPELSHNILQPILQSINNWRFGSTEVQSEISPDLIQMDRGDYRDTSLSLSTPVGTDDTRLV
ncbi:cytoplasmic protein [Tremella mesenterica]|uniref:Cytoplasmic protein n=1 Tax=Tremella mesenterica TaxID=5217 RepID=A0A4Q1BEB9_TREME|nr:cytoplasmic protein [Tremella mesenterica]